MCDVKKVWTELNKYGFMDELFPAAGARSVIRTEIVDKLPAYLAAHLDKPVSVLALLETWRAYVGHYRSAGIYAKLMAAMPLSEADRRRETEEGNIEIERSVKALDKAIHQVKFAPLRTPCGTEMRAATAIMRIRLRGAQLKGITMRDLIERYPSVVFQMG